MPRGVTLSRLLEDLALEVGESVNPNSRKHVRGPNTRLLQRHQRQLWQNYDWPHLRVWRDVELQAGQKVYSFPADLDLNRIEGAYINFSREWLPIIRLLSPEDYAQFDSDSNERFNPQMRWYLREDNQFEVWPLPSSNDQTVRFVGTKDLGDLVDDEHTCDIDSDLIVMFAAADILARRGAKDAGLKAQQAQQQLMRIRARMDPGHGFTLLGEPGPTHRRPFGPKPVDFTQG